MQTIKVPKEVMEVFYESAACDRLAKNSGFIKAIYYKTKAVKAHALARRALQAAHSATAEGDWQLNLTLGTVTKVEDPVAMKPKKTRAKKVETTKVETTKGEQV